jgi:hypothetical protein
MEPTLPRTWVSLFQAGFRELEVSKDDPPSGSLHAYCTALLGLIQQRPTAEAYLLVEDDVVFCRGLREYLETRLWPADPATIALVSPYCPEAYVEKVNRRPWFLICQGFYLAGSQAWVFPPGSARAIVEDLTGKVNPRGSDYEIP